MPLFPLLSQTSFDAVGFSPDGGVLAASSGGELFVARSDAKEATRVLPLPVEAGDRALALSVAPTADRIAIAFEKRGVLVADARSGAAFSLPSAATHVSLAWSPDARWLIGGQVDPWVTVFDVETRAERCVLDPDGFDDSARTCVAFAGAGQTLLSTAANKVCSWPFARVVDPKLKTREEPFGNVAVVRAKKMGRDGFRHVMGLALSPDQSQVALLEDTEGEGAISMLDLATGKGIGRALPIPIGYAIAFTGLPNVVAVADDERGIVLYDLTARGALDRTFDAGEPFEVRGLTSHPASRRLAAATSAGLRVWDLGA